MESIEDTVVGRLQVQVFTDTGRIHWNTIYSVVGMSYAAARYSLKQEMNWVLKNPWQYLEHPREMTELRIVVDGKVVDSEEFPETADKFKPCFDAQVTEDESYMNDFEERFLASMER